MAVELEVAVGTEELDADFGFLDLILVFCRNYCEFLEEAAEQQLNLIGLIVQPMS